MSAGDKLHLLCFRVAGRAFGVDIMAIREILRNQKFTPVAHAPRHVAGVLNLRGEIIPVVDMRKVLFRGRGAAEVEDVKLLVVCARGRTFGLLVDQVLEVVAVGPDELMPVPAGSRAARVVLAAFRREEASADEVAVLLSLGPLVEAGLDASLEEGYLP